MSIRAYSLEERNRALKEENDGLKKQLQFLDNICAVESSKLSPSEKLSIIQLNRYIHKNKRLLIDGKIKIFSSWLASLVGISRQTVSDGIHRLCKLDILLYDFSEKITKNCDFPITVWKLGIPADILKRIANIPKEDLREHGGKRLWCRTCGEDVDIEIRGHIHERAYCTQCGVQVQEKEYSYLEKRGKRYILPGRKKEDK